MSRVLRYVIFGVIVLIIAGVLLPVIMNARMKSDRIGCENHLREIGLIGVRHSSQPNMEMQLNKRSELPPGTFLNSAIAVEDRMSWYAYMLNVINDGDPNADEATKAKRRKPAGLDTVIKDFDPFGKWDSPRNVKIANYRLAAAICPARVGDLVPGQYSHTNYIASGGLGVDTPRLSVEEAGKNAGAYRTDGATPDALIVDGMRQTAQFIESTHEVGPWLRGGPTTLRGLDVSALPYIGGGRPFGGCHPGGAYASMADGSVQFIKDTIDPNVFRSMLTRAGGPDELGTEAP
jgi:prepilin-type processing-associated H-X9-DG protein